MSKVKNTKKTPNPEWLFGVDPFAIENQEAQGQVELIGSQQLPRKCNSPRGVNASEQYHKMGIKVLTSSKGDDLFMGVTLPKGWSKEATGHSMWNNLIDDKGRIRATFFYKAAFYDRESFINFKTRYHYEPDYSKDGVYSWIVVDSADKNKVIFSSGEINNNVKEPDYFKNKDLLHKKCVEFLENNFPDYKDINAYWD